MCIYIYIYIYMYDVCIHHTWVTHSLTSSLTISTTYIYTYTFVCIMHVNIYIFTHLGDPLAHELVDQH